MKSLLLKKSYLVSLIFHYRFNVVLVRINNSHLIRRMSYFNIIYVTIESESSESSEITYPLDTIFT